MSEGFAVYPSLHDRVVRPALVTVSKAPEV